MSALEKDIASMLRHQKIQCLYTNWRGEKRWRSIRVLSVHFGATEYHTEPQLLLTCIDIEKIEVRTFAFNDINTWIPTYDDH